MCFRQFVLLGCILGLIPLEMAAQRRPPARPGTGASRLPVSAPPYLKYIKSREETPSVTKVVLKNGPTVVVHEFRNVPVVNVMARIGVGSVLETESEAGISNLLARCLLRGTQTRPPGVIFKEVRTMGATVSAAADYDSVSVRLDAPSAQWKKAIELQSDILLNPLLEPAEIKREIESILLDPAQSNPEPEAVGRQKLLELAFPQHPISRPPAGYETALREHSREKLKEFHRTAFTLDRTLLVVAGDVITTDVLNEIARLYGKARSAAGKRESSPPAVAQASFRRLEYRGPISSPQVNVGFLGPPVNSDDFRALEVLRSLLSSGRSSILQRRLRDEKKLIRSSSAALEPLPSSSFFWIRMEVDGNDIDRALLAVFTELEILKREEPQNHEYERALSMIERQHWERLQTVAGRAEALAFHEARGGWKGMNDYLPRIRKVRPGDVIRVAKRYLTLENCSVLEYLPEGMEKREIPTDVVLKTLRDLLEPSIAQETASRERETIPAFDLDREARPFKYSEVRYPIQKSSIWRGPELFIKEDHTAPLVTLGLLFAGGKLLESPENSGITWLLLQAILRGGKKEEREQIHKQLEIYGARLVPIVQDDYFGFYFSILSRNVERGLDLLLSLVKYPRIEQETLDRDKLTQIARIRREELRAVETPILQALFRDFSYALTEWGSEKSAAALTPDAVRAWYQNVIENKKPILVIIGDTQGTSLASYFVRTFSGSRFQDTKLPDAIPKSLEKRVQVEAFAPGPGSRVIVGFQAPSDGDEDGPIVRVLENYLSGPGSKLHEELVERLGIARDVLVRYEPSLRAGRVLACIQTEQGNEEKAIQAFEEEIRKLAENPLSYKDYRLAINSAVGRFWIERQSHDAQIRAVVENFLAGLGTDRVVNLAAELQGVREEDLQEVARRVLSRERAAVLRVHGRGGKSENASHQKVQPSRE